MTGQMQRRMMEAKNEQHPAIQIPSAANCLAVRGGADAGGAPMSAEPHGAPSVRLQLSWRARSEWGY